MLYCGKLPRKPFNSKTQYGGNKIIHCFCAKNSMTKEEKEITKDVLWGMYQEHCNTGRHHETQRATTTNLIIVLVAGVTTYATFDKKIDDKDIPVALLVVVLGIFGALFSVLHYGRYSKHMQRAKKYRDALDDVLPQMNETNFKNMGAHIKKVFKDENAPEGLLYSLKKAGDKIHEKQNASKLYNLTPGGLHVFWVILHGLIIALGLFFGNNRMEVPAS